MTNTNAKIETSVDLQRQPVSHKFTSQRIQLHYVEWENEDAPPLIMVHGGSDHCRNWDWAAKALNKQFHIIAPDLRGHGDSDWSTTSYRLLDFIYDLNHLIAVNKFKKVSIIAHSFGGWISLLLAGLKPELVEKLVVIEGLDTKTPERRAKMLNSNIERIDAWMNLVTAISTVSHKSYPSFEAALEKMHSENSYLSEEQARHLTEHAVRKNADGTYSWKFDRHVMPLDEEVEMSIDDVFAIWRKISCPVLIIQGQESQFKKLPDDDAFNQFQNHKVVNIPNARHWPHHQELDLFLKEVTTFLNQ